MGEIYPDDEPTVFGDTNKFKSKALSNLDLYGTNISKLAASGKLDPVVGREEEILRVIQILGRRRKNNPVLVGQPGVGKTALVEGLALKIHEGDVPAQLVGKLIYTLELSTIVAGTKYRGQFEERMKSIVDELIENPHIIIFIDELHTLVGAGGSSGSLDASNIIKPALARGQIRCIGATTFNEFRENIEGDGALDRRFQKVIVEPTTLEQTKEILLNARSKYQDHHNVIYPDNVIELIVNLSDVHITDRFFPDKAIDIMDEVGSYKILSGGGTPKRIKDLEESLAKHEKAKLNAVTEQNYEIAAKERDNCLKIKDQINQEYAEWKKNLSNKKLEVTESDVLKVVSKLIRVPVEKINESDAKNLLNMSTVLSSVVIGQTEAIDKIAMAVQRNRVGIRRKNKTMGNFIFLGQTGVGKTFLAKKLSEYLFNSEDNVIRVDMNEYMERFSASRLIGAPPGYVGYESGGELTEKVRQNPRSVILFDEIEKAHPDVFNVLLQLLDEGYLTDSLGRKVNFRNCLIILTSNAGAKSVQEFGEGIGFKTQANVAVKDEKERTIFMKALNKKLSPEFLNRIDDIIIFNTLGREEVMKILENELKQLSANLENINGYKIKFTKSAKDLILNQGYDSKFGARPLNRAIEKLIENPITELILLDKIKKGDTIKVYGQKEEIKIEVLENKSND